MYLFVELLWIGSVTQLSSHLCGAAFINENFLFNGENISTAKPGSKFWLNFSYDNGGISLKNNGGYRCFLEI